MSFTLDIEVAASSADVFDFVADFSTMPRWYSAVRDVERIRGDGEEGTLYRVFRDLPGGCVQNDVEVTSYRSGREVEFTSRRGPTPFTYRYVVEPQGGGTKLALHGSISAEGLPGLSRLLAPMAEGLFQRGMRDNLDELRRILESRR